MNHVVYFPDLFHENKTFGDPKGHFAWGKEYYDLAKTVFPPHLFPHFIEGDDYNLAICARRGVFHY